MSTYRFPLPLAHLAFIAALALAIWTPLTVAHAQQVLPLKDTVPTIATKGVASAEVVPDIATISVAVDTERPTAADAARDNARAVQAMIGEIKAQ
ncbi:MAG: SIMPL domain-containing protein, partial [Methylocella sp.]